MRRGFSAVPLDHFFVTSTFLFSFLDIDVFIQIEEEFELAEGVAIMSGLPGRARARVVGKLNVNDYDGGKNPHS